MMRAYEYRHIIGFDDTNLVGNVYYTNHVCWQGRCREMFLRDHAPEVLEEINNGLHLVTTKVSVEYCDELHVFDEVVIRMRVESLTHSRITMYFEYFRVEPKGEKLVAHGEQQIACMCKENGKMVAAPIPASLRDALAPFL